MSGPPWEWLLFFLAVTVVVVLAVAMIMGIVASARERKACERCGHVNTGEKDKK